MSDSFWQGRSVLITGAAGLLGGWLMRVLPIRGAVVTGIDNDWSGTLSRAGLATEQIVEADVRDLPAMIKALEATQASVVFHLAAQSLVGPAQQEPLETFDTNVMGTAVTLEACRQSGTVEVVVAASSDKAYGDASGVPYTEEMPVKSGNPYAASKAAGDLVAESYALSYGMPVAITRCGNLYGGRDTNWSRLVPGTIKSLLEGERPVIRSDGTFVRDWLYIEDCLDGMIALAMVLAKEPTVRGQAFNFASEQRHSVLEVVGMIAGEMGSSLEPVILDAAVGEIPDQRVSSARARELLGWMPSHTIEEGLRKTIEWYRGHREALA